MERKTLTQIKDEVAKEYFQKRWRNIPEDCKVDIWDYVCVAYAEQFKPKPKQLTLSKKKLRELLYDAAYSVRMRNPNYSNFENQQQFDYYVSQEPELKKLLGIK